MTRTRDLLPVLLLFAGACSVPARAAEGPASPEFRTWTDTTGKYHLEAKLVEIKGDCVVLETKTGQTKQVPMSRLSEEDRKQADGRMMADAMLAFSAALRAVTDEEPKALALFLYVCGSSRKYPENAKKCAARIRTLSKSIIVQWQDALRTSTKDSIDAHSTALLLIELNPLFKDERFDVQASQEALRRLGVVPMDAVSRLKDVQEAGIHVAAVSLACEESLFAGGVFRQSAFDEFLTKARFEKTRATKRPADATNQAKPQAAVREFNGHFLKGIQRGRDGCGFAFFLDISRSEVPPSRHDGRTVELLKQLVANDEDLINCTELSRRGFKEGTVNGKPVDKLLHIGLFPRKGLPTTGVADHPVTFDPGPVTSLEEMMKANGPPSEEEVWSGKVMSDLALDGVVCWWGRVGLATSSQGAVTHVLVRELRAPTDSTGAAGSVSSQQPAEGTSKQSRASDSDAKHTNAKGPASSGTRTSTGSRAGKRLLFCLEPLGKDKEKMPKSMSATLSISKDGKIVAYPTGFTVKADVPRPATGVISIRVESTAAGTRIGVSIAGTKVWAYEGGPDDVVLSPPIRLPEQVRAAEKVELSISVGGGGPVLTGGIQSLSVIEEPDDAAQNAQRADSLDTRGSRGQIRLTKVELRDYRWIEELTSTGLTSTQKSPAAGRKFLAVAYSLIPPAQLSPMPSEVVDYMSRPTSNQGGPDEILREKKRLGDKYPNEFKSRQEAVSALLPVLVSRNGDKALPLNENANGNWGKSQIGESKELFVGDDEVFFEVPAEGEVTLVVKGYAAVNIRLSDAPRK